MFKPAAISVALSLAVFANAQAPAWGQCGGQGYTGPTTCVSGSTCVYSNQWYSQCVPGAATTSGTTTSTTSNTSTASTATTSTTSSPAPTGSSSAARFQTQGRVSTSGTSNTLVWPYTGLTFSFKGTQASVGFTVTGQNAFTISVDGATPSSKIELDAAGKISTGTLSSGTHTVEIHKVSEALYGTATFTNASITSDGTFVDAAPLSRRIEFVGDSITCGYGVDGVLPCTESTQTENAGKTYAALTGKSLSAEVSLIAWSGRGVVRNYPNSDGSSPDPPQPTLWARLNPLDSSSVYSFPAAKAPQAVVVNLGTNDFAYLVGSTAVRSPITLSQYQTGISNFVTTIFGKYPNTKVFLVSSPMLGDDYPSGQSQKTTQETALKNVASQIKNTYFVSFPTQGSDVGCDYHPLPATHQSMAALLTPVIKQQLGW